MRLVYSVLIVVSSVLVVYMLRATMPPAAAIGSAALRQRAHAAVLAAFAADSFALGTHWDYDAAHIAKHYNGTLTTLAPPIADYHKGKHAGDLTHIGYVALRLLDRLAADGGKFDLGRSMAEWRSDWEVESNGHYRDSATKGVLTNLQQGKTGTAAASDDDDMSHVVRWFPLIATINDTNGDEFVNNAKAITASFHSNPHSAVSAEFFARTIYQTLVQHQSATEAMKQAAAAINSEWLNTAIERGQSLATSHSDRTLEALQSLGEKKQYGPKTVYLGLSCGINYGVPAFVYHVYKYANASNSGTVNVSDFIIDTVNVGGNGNARAIILAAVLYSWRGTEGDAKINQWIGGLQARSDIEKDLAKIDGNSQ